MRLRVRDLDAMTGFYELAIGLRVLERDHDRVTLGAGDGPPLVELLHRPAADPRPDGTTGLFHLALLVPDRAELAAAIRRVTEAGWSFTGASDHLVSEAVYLRDPEGNGIEIYRDRPPEEWDWDAGAVRMATLPLDVPGVMADLPEAAMPQMSAGTVLGHVHLNVADIALDRGLLRRRARVRRHDPRRIPGALFLSAGGYHHHIGSNTWEGPGAPPPPAGALGLDAFEVVLPDAAALDAGARARRERGPRDAGGRGRRARRRPFEESSHSSDVVLREHGCPTPPTQTPGSDRAEAVGAIIRRRRQALGLTLRAFARQCEISPAHLSKVERGLASPSLGDAHADRAGARPARRRPVRPRRAGGHGARVVRAADAPLVALDAGNDPAGELRVAAQTRVATVRPRLRRAGSTSCRSGRRTAR